jgi:hypothetical protein
VNRRRLLLGAANLLLAPAIVRAGSLMPVRVVTPVRIMKLNIVATMTVDDRWISDLTTSALKDYESLLISETNDVRLALTTAA